MKKKDLLKIIDETLLDKLFSFCYARACDSYEAQELCSDIVFALIKSARSDGDITDEYAFIWRTARNVYADHCAKRSRHNERFYQGDPDDILPLIAQDEADDDSDELLAAVYKRIAFLTKAYRDVMVMFYIDGLSTADIAKRLCTSETAVRQRLFSARNKLRNEVKEMTEMNNKPISLDKVEFTIWGTGNPLWGDPRDVCTRQLSKQIVKLCHKKPMSASEIAEKLDVPTVYIEEELDILAKGANGEYGLLRRLDSGKYAINLILFDTEQIEKAHSIYTQQLPLICDTVAKFIEENEKEYLALPYMNKSVDLNMILWQQVHSMAWAFSSTVERILAEKYFADTKKVDRQFSVYGYYDNGKHYGAGSDGIYAENVCGYRRVHINNIYIKRIKQHFACGHDISKDAQLQLAMRAIDGLEVEKLSDVEKEQAAKAVECGYLYREGDTLYTKILVNDMRDNVFEVTYKLYNGCFEDAAEKTAEMIAVLIRSTVPEHLTDEWRLANELASLPVLDSLVEELIERGILTPPKDGVGAEGCWMSVDR